MPNEPFLINPAKKSRRSGKKKNKAKLPPTYHRGAVRKSRPVFYSGVVSGAVKRSPEGLLRTINPFGEEVLIVGANPKRKIDSKKKKHYAIAKHQKNPVAKQKKGKKKHHRRNPVAQALSGVSITKPMSLLMPIGMGIASAFAVKRLPGMLKLAPHDLAAGKISWMRVLAQLGISVGGGLAISKFLEKTSGIVFTVVGSSLTIMELLNTAVFKGQLSDVSGIDLSQYEEEEATQGYEEEAVASNEEISVYA